MERIVKIGENNIEVQTVLFDAKTSGKEVITERESYGQQRVDSERISFVKELEDLDDFDVVVEKAKVQAKIDKLDLIQIEMENVKMT